MNNQFLIYLVTIINVIAAAGAYSIISLYNFQDHIGRKDRPAFSFWSRDSWIRKYKRVDKGSPISTSLIIARNTWYTRFFKLQYKEAFPGSATIFVMFTDGFHLMQFVFTKCAFAAIAINTPHPLASFVVLCVVWGISFTFFLNIARHESYRKS